MTIWPQLLMLGMFGLHMIASYIQHGKPYTNPIVNATDNMYRAAILILIMGAGGFWKPLGW